ncbi:MAG: hypothetical protein ACPKPY_02180 [Nitrososphaeraceae archaeon]
MLNESYSPNSFIDLNSDPVYKKYSDDFRGCWESGPVGLRDCAIILNNIINYLENKTELTRKNIIKNFCIDNCDLEGISTSRLNYLLGIFEPISFLNKNTGDSKK